MGATGARAPCSAAWRMQRSTSTGTAWDPCSRAQKQRVEAGGALHNSTAQGVGSWRQRGAEASPDPAVRGSNGRSVQRQLPVRCRCSASSQRGAEAATRRWAHHGGSQGEQTGSGQGARGSYTRRGGWLGQATSFEPGRTRVRRRVAWVGAMVEEARRTGGGEARRTKSGGGSGSSTGLRAGARVG